MCKPLPGTTVFSGRGSDRCCVEYHLGYDVCLLRPSSCGLGVSYRCGRGSYTALAGELMLFDPGDHHVTERVRGSADFDVVGLEAEELEQSAKELGMRGPLHFRGARLAPPREVAGALGSLAMGALGGASVLELECTRARLVELLLRHCVETPAALRRSDPVPHAGVRAAREYLRSHYQEEPRLDELARLSGLSRFAFAHAFKRYVGMPPYAYFQLRRATEARRRIEQGSPIAEVAEELRYADVPALTRQLKAHFGATPARWRRCLESHQPRLASGPTQSTLVPDAREVHPVCPEP